MNLKTKMYALISFITLSNVALSQHVVTVSLLPISIPPERLDARSAFLYSEYIASELSLLGGDKIRIVPPSKCISILTNSPLAYNLQFSDQHNKYYPQSILSSSLGGDLIVYGFLSDDFKNEISIRFLNPGTLQEKTYVFEMGMDGNLESQGNALSSFIYSKISPLLNKSRTPAITLQFQGGLTWYPPSGANISMYLIPASSALDIHLSQRYGIRVGIARYWTRAVVEKDVKNLAPEDALLSTTTFFATKGGVFLDVSIVRLYTDIDLSIPFVERPNDLLPYWFLNGGIQINIFRNLYLGGGLTFYKQRDIARVSVSNGSYNYEITQLGWTYFPTFSIGIGL